MSRPRKGDPAPLGAWLWEMAQAHGYRQKGAFAEALGAPYPVFNGWSRADVAAIPDRKYEAAIARVLKLTVDGKRDYEAAVERQRALQRTIDLSTPKGEGAPKRVVELDDAYASRPEALPIIEQAGYPAWVLDAVKGHRRKGEDPGRAFWIQLAKDIYSDGLRAKSEFASLADLEIAPDVSNEALDAAARAKPRRRR